MSGFSPKLNQTHLEIFIKFILLKMLEMRFFNPNESIACKSCGHSNKDHRFIIGNDNNHQCFLCNCSQFEK